MFVNYVNTQSHRQSTSATDPEPEVEPSSAPIDAPAEQPPKKKKRKDKGKHRATGESSTNLPIDPQLAESQNNPSNEAFITAVVAAAASASSDPQNEAHHAQVRHASETSDASELAYPTYTAFPFPTLPGAFPPHPAHPPSSLFPEPYTGPIISQQHNSNAAGTVTNTASAPGSDAQALSDAAILEAIGLNLQNNEDLLRALQESDINKIASVLRSLGDAASASVANAMAANAAPPIPGPSSSTAHAAPRQAPTRSRSAPRQSTVPSALLLGQPSRNPDNNAMLPVHLGALGVPVSNQHIPADPEHQYMLANKWMSATKLGELAKTKGE